MKKEDAKTVKFFRELSPSNKKMVNDYVNLVHNAEENLIKDMEKTAEKESK